MQHIWWLCIKQLVKTYNILIKSLHCCWHSFNYNICDLTVCRGYHSLPPVWSTAIKTECSKSAGVWESEGRGPGVCKREKCREWRGWGPGWCMFCAGLILLHVETHSAGPQQILALTWSSVLLLMLKALNHIVIMSVFRVSIKSGLLHLNQNNGCLPNSSFSVVFAWISDQFAAG